MSKSYCKYNHTYKSQVRNALLLAEIFCSTWTQNMTPLPSVEPLCPLMLALLVSVPRCFHIHPHTVVHCCTASAVSFAYLLTYSIEKQVRNTQADGCNAALPRRSEVRDVNL